MKKFYSYLESVVSTEIGVTFSTKVLQYKDLSNVSKSQKVGLIFFDTETTGVISQKGNGKFSLTSVDLEWQNSYEKDVVVALMVKYGYNPKTEYYKVLNYIKSTEVDSNETLDLGTLLPKLYYKNKVVESENLKKLVQEYYEIKSELYSQDKLKAYSGSVELLEFYGVYYSSSNEAGDEAGDEELHHYFSPTEELTSQISNLVHWSKDKTLKASQLDSSSKYDSVLNLFNVALSKENVVVVAGHNVLQFDLPLLLLSAKKHDSSNGTTYYEQLLSVLKNEKLYVFDTKNTKELLETVSKNVPKVDKVKNSKQVTLQNFLGVKNPLQHTAKGDVLALVDVFERLLVLYVLSKVHVSSLRNFEDEVRKLKVSPVAVVSYVVDGNSSEIFKTLSEEERKSVQKVVDPMKKVVEEVTKKLGVVRNASSNALDTVLVNLVNNTLKEVSNESVTLYNEKKKARLKKAGLKKGDKLPGMVRAFARNREVENVPQFVRYFMKRKNQFLDRGYPMGYAIAMAYKISKRKFKVKD